MFKEEARKLRILRIAVSYPNENSPGAGLHPYYHSMCSDYDEMIIIAKRPGEKPKNRKGVKIVELELKNTALGTFQDNRFVRLLKLIHKYHEYFLYAKQAKKHIDDFQPDLVHVYTPMPIRSGEYARKKFGSKLVMSLHGSDALRMGKDKILGKYLLSIPDKVVVVGENMIDQLPKDAKLKSPIECIGNGVDLKMFVNQHRKRENQFIHVANLRWQKGQQYLIEGFAKFRKSHLNYKLVIIGDGEELQKLEDLCREFNVRDAIEFRGTQGRQDVVDELNRSRAFVLTSVSEGFPKVVIEAMATGTPVISSDVGNVKNVVGDSGLIFPMRDSDTICANMEKIISNECDWVLLSEKAENYAREYSWENVAKRLDDIYLS